MAADGRFRHPGFYESRNLFQRLRIQVIQERLPLGCRFRILDQVSVADTTDDIAAIGLLSLDAGVEDRAFGIPPAPLPAPAPLPQATNSSIGALLDDGLSRGDSRFEAGKGPYIYDINAYRWRLSLSDADAPDAVPVKPNDLNTSYIRFPDHYIDSLRGFAFKTYQPQQLAGPMKLFGVAVFLANSTALDAYGNKSFSITYDPHPLRSQSFNNSGSPAILTEAWPNHRIL